jgi:hypothetical protein
MTGANTLIDKNTIKTIHLNIWNVVYQSVDHSGRAVSGKNCLRSLERWDRGFDSHSRHECLCALILFVLSCV